MIYRQYLLFNNLVQRQLYNFGKIIKSSKNIKSPQNTLTFNNQNQSYMNKTIQIFQFSNQLKTENFNKLQQLKKRQIFIQAWNNFSFKHFINQKILRKQDRVQKTFDILSKIIQSNIFDHGLQFIIKQKHYGSNQKKFLTTHFQIIMKLIKNLLLNKSQYKLPQKFFIHFMQKLHEYYILLNQNKSLIIDYVFLINYSINKKLFDKNRTYFFTQKILIDKLFQLENQINEMDVRILLQYTNSAFIVAHYPKAFKDFVKMLINKLPQNWYESQKSNTLNSLIRNIGNLKYINEKITQGFLAILNRNITSQTFSNYIYAAVNYFNLILNSSNKNQISKEVKQVIFKLDNFLQRSKQHQMKNTKLFNQFKINMYSNLVPIFYRASVWDISFWKKFLNWLNIGKNYESIKIIHLYTLFQLTEIDKDIIPQQIINGLKQTKKNLLLNHSIRFQDLDLVRIYYSQYGSHFKSSFTIQEQFTNILRSVSNMNVKSQVLIRFFIVDILFNSNTVIQVNSPHHYIFNESLNSKKIDLKSQFRKRVLQKLGYKFIDIEIDQMVESNFQFLKKFQQQTFAQDNLNLQNLTS